MSDQHREFFAHLPLLFAAVADTAGWPMATALTGPPGFVSSPDAQTLRVSSLPTSDDPALAGLRAGAPAGLLGIDLGTRRRNRANGTVLATEGHGFFLAVRQSFGNCPQYIQAREVIGIQPDWLGVVERLGGLDARARTLIAGADTFFVASGSGAGGGEAGGLDMSHRGGRPGFVRVDDDVLTIPDFRGNRYFNTLGQPDAGPAGGPPVRRFCQRRPTAIAGRGRAGLGRQRCERLRRSRAAVAFAGNGRLAPFRCPGTALGLPELRANDRAHGQLD